MCVCVKRIIIKGIDNDSGTNLPTVEVLSDGFEA